MKKDNKFYQCLILFITFLKIGCFTFGGGYSMIPLIEEEVCHKRKWINQSEILDILAISESTPGPIAVNAATYIGFRVCGFWGSLFATFGLIVPSFVIIYIISFFYKDFMNLKVIQALFKGLKVGVILVLIFAIIKLSKLFKKDAIGIITFVIILITSVTLSIFNINIPFLSIAMIVIGILIGIITEVIVKRRVEK